MSPEAEPDVSYSLGDVVSETGLGADLLRAWERRHRAIVPFRTDGGTRRYRASDVARLRLLKSAVDAGYRIGRIAAWSDEQLIEATAPPARSPAVASALVAITVLDAARLERQLRADLQRLGAVGFACELVLPLLEAIGHEWAAGRLPVAGEHLATALLRTLLGEGLDRLRSDGGPRMVVGTPEGERHELGALAAALVAAAHGAVVTYLGPDLPAAELVNAVATTDADVLALGMVHLRLDRARALTREIADSLPEGVVLWVGGAHAAALASDGMIAITQLADIPEQLATMRA